MQMLLTYIIEVLYRYFMNIAFSILLHFCNMNTDKIQDKTPLQEQPKMWKRRALTSVNRTKASPDLKLTI